MFTGGAVVFNSNPTVQFQAQQLAKKQAKEEALNKYFDDNLKSLNTEGIRPQDLVDPEGKNRGIIDKINIWRQNWMQNKEGILRGGQPKMQSDVQLQDIRRQIAEAKAAGSFFNELGKARAKGDYNPDDDELHLLDKVTKPIYDPESKKADGTPYGWADVAPVVPEFDVKKQNEYWSAVTSGLKPGVVYDYDKAKINKQTGQLIVPAKEEYSPGQVKAMAERAGRLAMNDKSAKKYYKKILDSPESPEWRRLDEAYKSVFGADKMAITEDQLAQGDAIIKGSVPAKEWKDKDIDYAQRLYDKKMMAAFNSALIASRGGGNNETGKTTGNVLDDFPDTDFGTMKVVNGQWYDKDGNPKSGQVFLKGEFVPASLRSVMKSGGIDPNVLNLGITVTIKDGKIVSFSNKAAGTVTRESIEGMYQPKYDSERKGENMNFPGGGNPGVQPPSSSWRDRAKPVKPVKK